MTFRFSGDDQMPPIGDDPAIEAEHGDLPDRQGPTWDPDPYDLRRERQEDLSRNEERVDER